MSKGKKTQKKGTKRTKSKSIPKKVFRKKVQELFPIPEFFSTKVTFLITIACLMLIGTIVFWKYLSQQHVFIFEDVGSDTSTVFYPGMMHGSTYHKNFDGKPKYSFYKGMGENSYRFSKPGPTRILRPFLKNMSLAHRIAWVRWLYIICGGIVFFWLIKALNARSSVAFLGSILFAFSGYYIVGSSWYDHGTMIFHMIAIILGVELILSKGKWWLLPIAVAYLVNPRLYFLLEFLLIYYFVRALDVYDFNFKKLVKTGFIILGIGLLGGMMGAPSLGSVVNKVKNSPRIGGSVSYGPRLKQQPMFKLANAEHNGSVIMRTFATDLLGPGLNYKGWRNHLEAPLFYCGLLILLLIPQLFFFLDRKRKILYGLFLGVWLIMILFPWFRFAFYNFVGDYYKNALSLFVPITMLLCGLKALDFMVKGRRPNLILLGLSSVVLLLALFMPNDAISEFVDSRIQLVVGFFLLIYIGILTLWALKPQFSKWLLLGLLLTSAIEVTYLSHNSNTKRGSIAIDDWNSRTRHNDYTLEAVDFIKQQENPAFFRTDKTYGSVKSGYNDAQVQGYFGTKSYQSFNNNNLVNFLDEVGIIDGSKEYNTRWLAGLSTTSLLHPFASIKYLLSTPETFSRVDYDMYGFKQKFENIEVNENKYFIPLGFPIYEKMSRSEFNKLNNNQKRRALYNIAVLEDTDMGLFDQIPNSSAKAIKTKSDLKKYWKELADSAMNMTEFKSHLIKGTINMKQSGFLFFSIPYEQGWTAKVDGVRVPVDLVNIGFSGIEVPAGAHEIEIEFVPAGMEMGKLIFWIALLLYFGLLIWTKGNINSIRGEISKSP